MRPGFKISSAQSSMWKLIWSIKMVSRTSDNVSCTWYSWCCFGFKGLEGENCLRSSDCVEGLCCARHFWSKICKPVLKEGQVCTKHKRKGTHGLEIFQRCDCAEGLSCKTQRDGSKTSRSLHTCQRQWMNIQGIFFHKVPREATNRLDKRQRRASEGKQEWDTLFFLLFLHQHCRVDKIVPQRNLNLAVNYCSIIL